MTHITLNPYIKILIIQSRAKAQSSINQVFKDLKTVFLARLSEFNTLDNKKPLFVVLKPELTAVIF